MAMAAYVIGMQMRREGTNIDTSNLHLQSVCALSAFNRMPSPLIEELSGFPINPTCSYGPIFVCFVSVANSPVAPHFLHSQSIVQQVFSKIAGFSLPN
jgi:hypothetical protein